MGGVAGLDLYRMPGANPGTPAAERAHGVLRDLAATVVEEPAETAQAFGRSGARRSCRGGRGHRSAPPRSFVSASAQRARTIRRASGDRDGHAVTTFAKSGAKLPDNRAR